MKKLIAIMLSLALTLSLAACGSKTPAETTVPTEQAVPVGSVIAAMGAVFELVYDHEGVVLELKGLNDAGQQIADNCQQHLGRACVHVIRSLLRYASDNQLIGDARTLSVRVRHGDPLPEDTFLDTIVDDTQYLADEECTGIRMVKLDATRLTGEGLIDEDTAGYMAAVYFQGDVTEMTVSPLSQENIYTVTWQDAVCTVDAVTGLVQKG